MSPRTRHFLAAAALVTAALPAVAAAAPTIGLDNLPSYPGGYVRGPDVPVYFTAGFSPNALSREVVVTAGPAGQAIPFNGNGGGHATLRGLVDGAEYDLVVTARQQVFTPLLVTEETRIVRHIRVDATPPSPAFVTINGGNGYTNRFSIPVNIAASGDRLSGTVSTEIRLSQSAFGSCDSGALDDGTGCYPFPRTGIYNGFVTLAPGPDGVRKVWVRTRDRAYVSCQSPGLVFSSCDPTINGNVSAEAVNLRASVLLDTTPPVAALTTASPTGVAGSPVPLDATTSSDPGGSVASGIDPAGFRWDFGDGGAVQTGRPAAVTHLYPGPGTYRGEVRTTDRAGNAGALRFTVVVNPAPAPGGDPVPTPDPTPDPTPIPPATTSGTDPVPPPASPVVPPVTRPTPPAPRIRGLVFDPDRGFVVNVNRDGVLAMRVLIAGTRRQVAVRTKRVTAGQNVIPLWRGLVIRSGQRRRASFDVAVQLNVSGVRTPVRQIGLTAAAVLKAAGR
ncbi:MAG: PKD domain-containing protein [Thermoleophilia bacterium]